MSQYDTQIDNMHDWQVLSIIERGCVRCGLVKRCYLVGSREYVWVGVNVNARDAAQIRCLQVQ